MAVHGGVGDGNAFALHAVAGPDVVEVEVVAEIFAEHRAVQRADDGDVQRGDLLKHGLYLSAVFAHNAEIVTSGFAGPLLFHIQRAELAEGVGGEEYFIVSIVGHNDLGPVYHGSG